MNDTNITLLKLIVSQNFAYIGFIDDWTTLDTFNTNFLASETSNWGATTAVSSHQRKER